MTATSTGSSLPAEIPERFNIAEHFLDAQAAQCPRHVAVAGEPSQVSYAELAALMNRVGNALRKRGVSRGDRVLIALPDSPEFVASFFGSAKIGAVAVPVNPYARSADFIHYIENSEPRAAIVHAEALEAFLPASGERPQMPIVVVGEGRIETHKVSCAMWRDWIECAADALAPAETSSRDSAFMLYTSGSGGLPKAAVHRH
jgi:acyl-coenzyme A synthetase/AMP-(fatty) acid ligase